MIQGEALVLKQVRTVFTLPWRGRDERSSLSGSTRMKRAAGWGETVTPPRLASCFARREPTLPLQGRVSAVLANRDAAADGAVEHLRGLLDPVGGGVQRIGDRGLRCLGAIRRARAHIAQLAEFLFEAADAIDSVEQFVAHRQRRHHGEARIADLAELAAQILNPRFKTLGELQKAHLLPLLAGHPVFPSVDGDDDVIHELSPASSTERMVPIAASSLSAISRLARSSRRDFTSDPSSSSASRERSAPSAWIRLASSFSSRSASRRRSTAPSSASSAAISRRVTASISADVGSGLPEPLAGRSLMQSTQTFPDPAAPAKSAVRQSFRPRKLRGK